MKGFFRTKYVYVFLALIIVAAGANAQATRTWVSGVGDDANPCSRTAPCKTFAGAISKTASGGVIDALDPGGYGAVTITKPITIEGNGTLASILASGVNGVTVNITSGSNRHVVLRNLLIDGSGSTLGINGIRFVAGDSLTVENCTIEQFSTNGIDFQPSTAAKLNVINTYIYQAGANGILSKKSSAGSSKVFITRSVLAQNATGFRSEDGTGAEITDTDIANNTSNGVTSLSALGEASIVVIASSRVFNNGGVGLSSTGAASNIAASNTDVIANGTGMQSVTSGVLTTFGRNRVAFNGVVGSAFNASLPES
ncbi:MAG TPA: right-handed parallel beta-helix repeat-containing protein [Thermoanaerobaculia bacterium]|nr:right-handed parallel beta-helix repeat-containing protein [Thermoanaerobaculia bacterium]